MKLKTATLIAICGISVNTVWHLIALAQSMRMMSSAPLLARLSILPFLAFNLGLLAFFVTLYAKE